MRRTFSGELYKAMEKDDRIVLLVGDLGYIMFDKIRDEFPDRFFNVGAAEFSMVGIASGMALEGKIPFCYSITPFLLYRPFELLRTYVNHENIPIKLIGSGRDNDYKHDGYSHFAGDAKQVMDTLPNICQLWPKDKKEIPSLVKWMITNNKPTFLSLSRA